MAFRIVRGNNKGITASFLADRFVPLQNGENEEEELHAYYKENLKEAAGLGLSSAAFPLEIKEKENLEAARILRIAADEINSFLAANDMEVYLVVPENNDTEDLAGRLKGLKDYIDRKLKTPELGAASAYLGAANNAQPILKPMAEAKSMRGFGSLFKKSTPKSKESAPRGAEESRDEECAAEAPCIHEAICLEEADRLDAADTFFDESGVHVSKLNERIRHLSDTFSQYLLYLIQEKGMENAEVYKRAIVDKKTFSKIKNNADYHPQKITALCLCVGAKLNLDESKDLLARAGYALSPCDKTDIIFSYFIENKIYDMIELDIQLEEHGLPCIIE